jgi:hypothetical protein
MRGEDLSVRYEGGYTAGTEHGTGRRDELYTWAPSKAFSWIEQVHQTEGISVNQEPGDLPVTDDTLPADDEDAFQRHLARELLRYAVQTAIFSPYGGVLDVRRAVVLDGSDFTRADGKRGRMRVMTADEYDTLTGHPGGIDALKTALGHDFTVYDGRTMPGL